jgi:hypothetical protein
MIFKAYESTDIVLGKTSKVSSGFWSDGDFARSQSYLATSSAQTVLTGSNAYDVLNGLYYYNIYNDNPLLVSAQVHFSIAYGDYQGSGSSALDTGSLYINPTKTIYSQYKNYLLPPSDTKFSFRTGSLVTTSTTDTTTTVDSDSIYVISFSADKYKDRVDEGQLEFSLSGSSGVYTFIDDSSVSSKYSDVYNIISGSIVNGVPSPYYTGSILPYNAYGLFYPKTGTVVLNATALSSSIGLPVNRTNPSSGYALNQNYLYSALIGCVNKQMKVRKSEYIPATHYFTRIKNRDFNYSNNPSYISDGTDGLIAGTIKNTDFITDPKTYITTIGLYNDSNELVAVAKLSQPMLKSFDNELLVKILLTF